MATSIDTLFLIDLDKCSDKEDFLKLISQNGLKKINADLLVDYKSKKYTKFWYNSESDIIAYTRENVQDVILNDESEDYRFLVFFNSLDLLGMTPLSFTKESVKDLKLLLEQAVESENYELAAVLRDKIKSSI